MNVMYPQSSTSGKGAIYVKIFGSSPCLRPELSLSAVGHYTLSTVVFISKTVRHALNELDLVVKAFCDPVAVTIADVVDNGLKPTCQRPGHPLQRLLGALARTLNQLRERLAGWFFILALKPQAQVLHPVNHLAQLRKAPSPLVPRDQLVDMELIGRLQPTATQLLKRFGFLRMQLFLHRS